VLHSTELTTKGFEWQNMDGQVQHDAHELNRLLIDALEKSLKRTSGEALCRNLYEGRCANTIRCLTCQGVSERSEVYYDINLQVLDCPDLCTSLRRHCAAEMLTGDSAYQCDGCRTKRDALRCTVLRTLPQVCLLASRLSLRSAVHWPAHYPAHLVCDAQVLTFSCSRFRIDRSTNWNRVKVTSRNEFPLVFNMQPYMEGSNSGVHEVLHSNPDVEKDLTEALRRGREVCWLDDTLNKAEQIAKELLEQFGDTARLADVDEAQYEAIARHLAPHWFAEASSSQSKALLYELHAVIMHTGSAHSGHYFAYIKDNLSEGQWVHPNQEDLLSALSQVPQVAVPEAAEQQPVTQTEPVGRPDTKAGTAGPGDAKMAVRHNGNAPAKAPTGGPARPTATHNQYYLQGDGPQALVCVDVTSALGLILRVMLNTPTVPRRPQEPGAKSASTHAPSAAKVYKTDFIAAQVGRLLKNSWAAVYKSKLGSLERFMQSQSDVLKLTGKGEVTLVRSNIRLITAKDYQQLVNSQPTASTDGKAGASAAAAAQRSAQTEQSQLDEALARSLQMEDDTERHQQEQHGINHDTAAAGAGDEWETAGMKKKLHTHRGWESATGKDHTEPPEAAVAQSVAAKAVNASLQLCAAQARKQLLMTEILGHFFGHYFEFNDTAVTPIELRHLSKAFEGANSAYILVYRRLAAPRDAGTVLAEGRKRLQDTQVRFSPHYVLKLLPILSLQC
jgi:hypothetical protein